MLGSNLILIIEDSSAASSPALILKQAGYSVLSAPDFDTAIQTITSQKTVLVICNDASDNSNSVEICLKIRAAAEMDLPPVCLVGAKIPHSDQIHLKLKTGARQYIAAPFEPLNFIRIVTGLIEEHRTKNSLEEKDLIFRSLIEGITDIITVISIDGAVLYESPSVERILGRNPADSLGSNAFEWIHPNDRQKVIDYIVKADREAATKGIEYRIRHENGSWRVFHSVGRFNRSIFKTKTVLITSRDITERNLLNERHHTALEKARMVWWEWCFENDEVITSDNFAEIYGLASIKKSSEVFEIIHPDDAVRHRQIVEGIAKSGGSYHTEFRIIRQDNAKILWLEETASALLNDENEVERIVGIAVDISARKQAEKKLRESEEKFKALFRGMPIPVYIWQKLDAEDDFVLVGSNAAGDRQTTSFSSRYFGMKSSELLDDEPEMLNGLHRCLDEQEVVHLEAEYHHQETGELKILDLYFVCISSSLVMVISRDITQTKFVEEERAKLIAQIEFQNQRLNDIIASIPGVVWETQMMQGTVNQQTDFVSDYIEKMTGYLKEEWLSEPNFWLKVMHPEDRQQAIEKSNEFVKNKSEGFLEYRFLKSSGEVVWTETQMKTVKNNLDEVVSLTGITLDITERKKAEEALLKSEEQLRQSQRLESVGKLAGGIAHDFNNMLTAINGYSDLILRGLAEDDPIRPKVLEIKKAGERSALLTQQLLAFSRRQILKPQRLDLNFIVLDMSSLLHRLIGEHIELHIELSDEECRVEADSGQLSQVIMNLVVNARDAMPQGGDLTIKTENVSLDEKYAAKYVPTVPGDYVRLSVIDNGIGLDDKIKEHIFEPFYTTKEKGSGTGLGLATVYGIVKQSGGYIWVDSEISKGATFDIYLPRISGELETQSKKGKIETDLNGSETVLLVEDEAAVRELILKVLEVYGYRIIQANDGIEALEIFQKSSGEISLLITDIVMPRMNGRELAAKIKKIAPNVRVLFSSGYSDDRNMMHGTNEEYVDFINKPFVPEELARKVRFLLDRKN